MATKTSDCHTGFTLLELSIVLVIIGLIVGGITVGSSMIRAAEVRSIITQVDQQKTAINSFRDKYLAMPGDMPNATDFWGEAHATPATCITTASTGTETCNGDGDNMIGDCCNYEETYRAWQHLANAEMIEGSFNGIMGSRTEPNVNAPASKMGNATYWLRSLGYWVGNNNYWANDYATHIHFGNSVSTVPPISPVLTSQEAWNLDKKVDDGKPASGSVFTLKGGGAPAVYNPDCATTSSETTAEYNLTYEDIACTLYFIVK